MLAKHSYTYFKDTHQIENNILTFHFLSLHFLMSLKCVWGFKCQHISQVKLSMFIIHVFVCFFVFLSKSNVLGLIFQRIGVCLHSKVNVLSLRLSNKVKLCSLQLTSYVLTIFRTCLHRVATISKKKYPCTLELNVPPQVYFTLAIGGTKTMW